MARQEPAALYTQCRELFARLQALTGGDRGATDVFENNLEGYERWLRVHCRSHPHQGTYLMREVCFRGMDGEGHHYYELRGVPGKWGDFVIRYSGEVEYNNTTRTDLDNYFVFWTHFADRLDTLLQEFGL